jgi:septum site-determining protein MinC
MSSGTAAAPEIDDRWGVSPQVEGRPAAILKGGPRGLEILVDRDAAVDAIAAALTRRLEEAPGFFRGSDVRVRIDGALPFGCLARLEEIAARFELAIVEVGPRKPTSAAASRREGREASAPVPQPALAAGTAPAAVAPISPAALVLAPESIETQAAPAIVAEPSLEAVQASSSVQTCAPEAAQAATREIEAAIAEVLAAAPEAVPALEAAALEATAPAPALEAAATAPAAAPAPEVAASAASVPEAAASAPERTRMVVGPVRSGVILDHPGNLVVVGDVNPGAEVRAEGNIIILGRLRGIAHAGIGRDRGFILALRLEPQQLRIGRLVARAPDASSSGTEIAYVTDKNIVVERYAGKLPSGLAAGI